jgi:transcriptional regulator with XRE-family HTH domain
MTDYRLAKLLELRTQTISQWRAGKTGIGAQFAQKFADACELPTEYVYACIELERAKDPAVGKILANIAEVFANKSSKVAAVTLAVGMLFALPIFTGSNDNASSVSRYTLCATRRYLRRVIGARLKALLRWFNARTQGDNDATYPDPVCRTDLQRSSCRDDARTTASTTSQGYRQSRSGHPKTTATLFQHLHEANIGWIRRLQEQRRPLTSGRNLQIAVATTAIALGGCSTLRDPAEIAWQSLHAADIAMTDHIVNDPCFNEGAPLTRALIGSNPSHAGVAAWGIGSAALHLGVSHWLIDDHPTAYKVWQAISITDTAGALGKGFSIGVRIGAPNKPQNCSAY